MAELVDGFDVASAGEIEQRRRGSACRSASPARASATPSSKRAIRAGVTINLESEGEAERALAHRRARSGITPRLAVRVNPPFGLKGAGMKMGGHGQPVRGRPRPRPGAGPAHLVDAGADWRGLHIYAGSQALSADALIELQRETVALAAVDRRAGRPRPAPRQSRRRLRHSLFRQGRAARPRSGRSGARQDAWQSARTSSRDTDFAIELGRWLVGEAGVYLTRIVDRKESRGKTFLVTDGGLHHMLAASGNFGQLLRRNYPVAIASRFGAEPEEEVTIVGCLCTPLDLLADEVMLPRAEVGDLVAIFCAGAYGLSASPQAFLSQPTAREMLV